MSYLIKDKAVEKLLTLKNPRYSALLLVEFFLTMLLVGGILLYLDAGFNVIGFPYNIAIFAAIAYAVLHFYNYTSFFRKTRVSAIRRNSTFKTFMLEFILFIIILGAAYIYQNPAINVLPYPYNLVLFLAILAVPLYLYVDEKFLKASF